MPASYTGGAQDPSPPTWFASKTRSPKETAKTLVGTSASARAVGVVCSATQRIHIRAHGPTASQSSTRACGVCGEVCLVGLDARIVLRRSPGHVATQMVRVQVQSADGNSADALRNVRQRQSRWHRLHGQCGLCVHHKVRQVRALGVWRDRIHVRARGRPASQSSPRACATSGEVCLIGLGAGGWSTR